MNNFPWGEDSVANWITYFANLKQDNGKPFELLGWKVNDNEYTLTLKNKKGETIKLLFIHRLDLKDSNISVMNVILNGQEIPGYVWLDLCIQMHAMSN